MSNNSGKNKGKSLSSGVVGPVIAAMIIGTFLLLGILVSRVDRSTTAVVSDNETAVPSPAVHSSLSPTVLEPVRGGAIKTFPETGKTVRGAFLTRWETGGLPRYGYAITDEIAEVNDIDNKTYTVQYFQGAVFEYHPENQDPYDVLLSQLGRFQYNRKYPDGAPSETPNLSEGSIDVTPTGKRLGEPFLSRWNALGGESSLGFPVSNEFEEVSELEGKVYIVQYYEYIALRMLPGTILSSAVEVYPLGVLQYKIQYGMLP